MRNESDSAGGGFFSLFSNAAGRKAFFEKLPGDLFGGTAAMLVALPSAIAFGLIIFAPLGAEFSARAAIGGVIGTIMIGLITPVFGGTKKLISAPCAPAAAVLSVFVGELFHKGTFPPETIPLYVMLAGLMAGAFQMLAGYLGGGKFIKYIPYPVVAGYLSGVGILIFFGQFPKFLGLPGKMPLWQGLMQPHIWRWESISVGAITIAAMLISPKFIKKVPASIVALIIGIASYFFLSAFRSELLSVEKNPLIIGPISASLGDIFGLIGTQWSSILQLDFGAFGIILLPTLTLAVLLSIDTLKTCVVLDALTYSRHDSNKELRGQGMGNAASALACGIPGAGTMGATLVNLNSGARSSFSGFIVGLSAVIVLIFLGNYIAWIPVASLAGILMIVGVRMLDFKSVALLKHSSTRFDFAVILAVVISAVSLSLIAAAGVGIGLAILLFLREQMRSSVIKKKVFGNQVFSKKNRLQEEISVLSASGSKAIILELQGQLFFGTTDQLFTELEPYLKQCRYVLLNMRRVLSVDYTAVHMLKQILARIKANDGHLVFSSVPLSLPTGQNIKSYLEKLGLTEKENLHFFDDGDSALQWIEEEILRSENALHEPSARPLEISEIELFSGFTVNSIRALSECLVEKSYAPGEAIFNLQDQSDEIYFIRRGEIKIILPLAGGMIHHLATFSAGGFFGDMSFLDRGTRSARAVADTDVDIYIMKRSKFDMVMQSEPAVAALFFERLAYTIAQRLRLSNIELKALKEN